ncbi:unnamed protein product [Brassica rapa subsp. narinosa]
MLTKHKLLRCLKLIIRLQDHKTLQKVQEQGRRLIGVLSSSHSFFSPFFPQLPTLSTQKILTFSSETTKLLSS